MTKFKKGDRVIYLKPVYGDGLTNPTWGGSQGKIMGTVLEGHRDNVLGSVWVSVKWDNGESNKYAEEALEEFDPSNDY